MRRIKDGELGMVYPPQKSILSWFTHPHVVSAPVFLSSVCSVEDKRFYGPYTLEGNGHQIDLVTNILQNIFVCVLQSHTGKCWQNFHFWVNYPFFFYINRHFNPSLKSILHVMVTGVKRNGWVCSCSLIGTKQNRDSYCWLENNTK